MDSLNKNKILTTLKSDGCLSIINSTDFYFQKAQDVLSDFLNIEVGEELKTFLISKRKEYSELKHLFEESDEFLEFGRLIFTLISYCDSNAYKKNDFNQYQDKRVLALAFVRMNNWIEQLIAYKFEGQLTEGSIKNAIEYLLNPKDNFTMLSENHRSQISENLFKKSYNKNTFKDDFVNYFSEFSINVKNPLNYTHLLTRITYSISTEWKESIIGLICPDTTGWQKNAIDDTGDGNPIILWNHKKPNGTRKTLKLLRQCIEENGFFRIFYTSSYQVNYIAEIVDFVESQDELDKSKWNQNYDGIAWYVNNFNDYTDGKKSASWIYLAKKIYKVNPGDYSDFKYYKSFGYPSVGCQAPITSFNTFSELKAQKRMENIIKLLNYKKQIILQGPPGTGKTREAKIIAKQLLYLEDIKDLEDNDQFKLIQFHPSYTYDDFVRGIVAKPNTDGEGIIYEAENKTLGKFAKVALDNFLASRGKSQINSDYQKRFNILLDEINEKIAEGKTYKFGDKSTAEIISVGNDSLIYNFPEREAIRYKLLFSDIEKIFNKRDEIKIPIDLRDRERDLELTMKGKYPYYYMILKNLEKINLPEVFDSESSKIDEKKYILIIDEINRANLSSVLGELIYALEYRGEEVESIYKLNGSSILNLPPNLFIIGTMNTADRSVGHIDYAIRRRFAFVDVLPEILNEDFETALFEEVSTFFVENINDKPLKRSEYLSSEFNPKDVWLGHSYFIKKDNVESSIRLEYEIIPILEEYLKDGILIDSEELRNRINNLHTFLS